MTSILGHIERARSQPYHVRRRLTFGIAGGISALIAVVWVSFSLSTGAFAIQGDGFAQAVGIATSTSSGEQSVGSTTGYAAAAAAPMFAGSKTAAQLEVVPSDSNVQTSNASQTQETPNIIPF